MYLYKDAEAEKWVHRPLGSKLLCERLGIRYEDYQNGSDDDVNAFLDLLAEIPLEEKRKSMEDDLNVLGFFGTAPLY